MCMINIPRDILCATHSNYFAFVLNKNFNLNDDVKKKKMLATDRKKNPTKLWPVFILHSH